MPGQFPGSGAIVASENGFYRVPPAVDADRPSPQTHWYFKFGSNISVKNLAACLCLEHDPQHAPFLDALYLETGEPAEIVPVAAIIRHTEDECIFAVDIEHIGVIDLARIIAIPTQPI